MCLKQTPFDSAWNILTPFDIDWFQSTLSESFDVHEVLVYICVKMLYTGGIGVQLCQNSFNQ